jgi:hypothetical protein
VWSHDRAGVELDHGGGVLIGEEYDQFLAGYAPDATVVPAADGSEAA